jgi:hypothetical protein
LDEDFFCKLLRVLTLHKVTEEFLLQQGDFGTLLDLAKSSEAPTVPPELDRNKKEKKEKRIKKRRLSKKRKPSGRSHKIVRR